MKKKKDDDASIFEKKYPELFRKLSKKLEKSNSWKGHFLSSAFVVEAYKI